MQPLDVDGFSLLKFTLRGLFQSARADFSSRALTIGEVLPLLCDAIRTVLHGRRWAHTFDGVGYGAKQQCVRKRMLLEIQAPGGIAVPSSRPSDDQLRLCLPKKFHVPANVLLKCVDRLADSVEIAHAAPSEVIELATSSSHARPRRVLPPSFVIAAERFGRKRVRGCPRDISWQPVLIVSRHCASPYPLGYAELGVRLRIPSEGILTRLA